MISDPSSATEIIRKNVAAKIECGFVFYFTITIVASIYFSMWDHTVSGGMRTTLNKYKLSLQILNQLTIFVITVLFSVLFVLFFRLIAAQNDFLQPMKCQVGTFFTIAIVSLTIKLGLGIGEAIISFKNIDGTPLELKYNRFFLSS